MAKKTAKQAKPAARPSAGRVPRPTDGMAAGKDGAGSVLEAHPTLKTTVAQIEKRFGEGAIMPLGAERQGRIAGISTGSLSLDMALGGQGIPSGRFLPLLLGM